MASSSTNHINAIRSLTAADLEEIKANGIPSSDWIGREIMDLESCRTDPDDGVLLSAFNKQ